jgi:hypothetical protein
MTASDLNIILPNPPTTHTYASTVNEVQTEYTWGRTEDETDLGLAQGGEGGAVAVRRPQQGGERGRSYHTKINKNFYRKT